MIERFVCANGLQHHVITWGEPASRETVILCHGFLDMGLGFFKLAPLFAEAGYRVIAFDFRGHGETQWIGRGGYYHFADYVLDLHELVPQLTSEPFHLLGHSMGGTVSTLYAAAHLERVRSLALLEGYGPPGDDTVGAPARLQSWLSEMDSLRDRESRAELADLEAAIARLRRRNPTLDTESLRFLAQRSTEPHPRAPGLTWRFDPMHRTRAPMGFDVARFLAFSSQIRRRTLIVQGEHGLRTGDDALRLAHFPLATQCTIAGAAHMLHWTHATETAQAVLEFWAEP